MTVQTAELARPARLRLPALQPGILLAVAFALVLFAALVVPGVIAPTDPYAVDPANAFQPPGPAHLFGTDQLGRDLLSRVLHGGQTSLLIGLLAIVVSGLIGIVLGAAAGYYGGWVDWLISRVYDLMRTRQLQSVLIGKSRRVPVTAVHAFVERLTEQDALT